MKFEGFIGPAYTLDSVNVDAQRCVNLYPEVIESGKGKAAQVAYLRGTPGLTAFATVGEGPIRCVHVDSIGRVFVVSGSQLFALIHRDDWTLKIIPYLYSVMTHEDQTVSVDITADTIFSGTAHGYYTGLKVRVSSSVTLPTGLAAATDYWVIVSDANKIKLASTLANAVAGTAIDLTGQGSGAITVTPQASSTPPAISISAIDVSADSLVSAAHGMNTGAKVSLRMNGTIPTGLALATDYYVIASSVNVLKLASSVGNASAGTAVDITAISADEWSISTVKTNGIDNGDPVPLSTSTGTVKASSMSFGGEGTDSSTIFVDGTNNYLFKDIDGVTTFNIMGVVPNASVIFNIVDDIVISTTQNVYNLNNGGTFSIVVTNGLAGTTNDFYIYTTPDAPLDYICAVYIAASQSMTSAEFVERLNDQTIDTSGALPFGLQPDPTWTIHVGVFSATGGGSEQMDAAFNTTPTVENFSQNTSAGLEYGSVPTATDIRWSDGYFILTEGETNRFRVSDLQDFNVDALSFASSEGSPDIVLAIEILNRYLYIFNEETTEVFANTGNADFPFERIQGGYIEVGCLASNSVCKVGTSICWLGRTQDGDGIIFAMEGLTPRRISTHAIEQAIRGYADPSSAVGYSYQNAGHVFYVLNFDEATWVFDVATQLWHERAYTNEGTLERHRAQHCAFVPSQRIHLVSDYETNELYTMSEDVYSDDGDPITALRSFPHFSSDMLSRMFFKRLQLDMEVGIGLDGAVQGSDPTVMLDWSDDGGHTWSSESWALADAGSGQIGDYKKRVIWRRLGSSRDRVFRIKMTDPVKRRFIDAQIEVEGGQS